MEPLTTNAHVSPHTEAVPSPPAPLRQRSGTNSNLFGRALTRGSSKLGSLLRAGSLSKMTAAPPLVEHVNSGGSSAPAIEVLARDLARLASSPHSSGSLVALGFLMPVVNMAAAVEESEVVRLCACRCLAHLASRREHIPAIHDAGALKALLAMLESGTPALALGALEALRPLSRDAMIKDALRDAATVKRLLSLVGAACEPAADRDTTAVAEAALCVVRNVSASAASQEVLKGAGAIKVLVALLDALSAASHPTTCARAAMTLSNLVVSNQKNKDSLRKAGAIPKLVAMLEAADGEVRSAATEALANLAVKNTANKDAVREAGGVRMLATMYNEATGRPAKGPGTRGTPRTHAADESMSRGSSRPGSQPGSQPSSQPNSRPMSRPLTPTEHTPRSRDPSPENVGHEAFSSAAALVGAAAERSAAAMTAASHGPPGSMTPAASPPATPPDTPRESGVHTGPSVERLQLALRNLVLANGLNTALVVACGVPLKELEGLPTAAKAKKVGVHVEREPQFPAPPPPKPPCIMPTLSTPACGEGELDQSSARSDGHGFVGVGLTKWSKTGRA